MGTPRLSRDLAHFPIRGWGKPGEKCWLFEAVGWDSFNSARFRSSSKFLISQSECLLQHINAFPVHSGLTLITKPVWSPCVHCSWQWRFGNPREAHLELLLFLKELLYFYVPPVLLTCSWSVTPCLRCPAWWSDLHTSWNNDHNRFTEPSSSYRGTKWKK